MLAGGNDMELLARTGTGRDINRHYYGRAEVIAALERPVVRDLQRLIRLRNDHPAFQGALQAGRTGQHSLALRWRRGAEHAELLVDFATGRWALHYTDNGPVKSLTLECAAGDGRGPEFPVAWNE